MTTVNSSAGPQPLDTYTANNTSSMSSDELLILFGQASNSNAIAENGIKDRIKASIDAKTLIGRVQSDIQQLQFGTGDVADASTLKKDLEAAIAACNDPDAKADMQKAYDSYFNQSDDWHKDNALNKDEAKSLGSSLDNTNSSLDDHMQILTLNLKQSQEKFAQITNLIKDIMDSNNKIFETINQRT